ncbi:MAG: acetylglutamate kinase [Bacteroidetes bacterium]|nr:acetylglutamate kinase [Bacteroidota bacterium]
MKKIFVIKIGGNVIDDETQLSSFLDDFSKIKEMKILIHGGGKIATELSKQLGIESKMIDGRRITDSETLKVVQMVYGGLINKNIVAKLQGRKCNAIGLTGADGNIILAKKRKSEIDYGFVGDVKKVNAEKIFSILNSGLVPVIAPLTHNGKGQILNTNADTIAAAVAAAVAGKYNVTLIYCFEKSGVLRNVEDENSVIKRMNSTDYKKHKAEGIISKGMIPKLDNAFDAIKKKVKSVVICHSKDLSKVASNKKVGTRLEK